MKKILLFMLTLLSLSFLNSCSLNDEDATSKTVTYEAFFEEIPGNSDLYLIGEYIDATGKTVKVDAQLPFRVVLNNVPMNVKTGFRGYIFSIRASYLKGTMRMAVENQPMNKTVYSNKSEIDIYTNASLGFDGDELKRETSFSFKE